MDNITTTQEEKIKDLMKKWKFPQWVFKKGFEGIVRDWGDFVRECEKGYDFTFDEYLNDLATRDIIENILDEFKSDKVFVRQVMESLIKFDTRLKALLIETEKFVWGTAKERDLWHWGAWRAVDGKKYANRKKWWWHWGIVKNAKGQLLEDLQSWGYFDLYRKKTENNRKE